MFLILDGVSTQTTNNSNDTLPHHNHSTLNSITHNAIDNDADISDADQLVKPSKIHVQPLHADDLLYESMKFDPSAGLT